MTVSETYKLEQEVKRIPHLEQVIIDRGMDLNDLEDKLRGEKLLSEKCRVEGIFMMKQIGELKDKEKAYTKRFIEQCKEINQLKEKL